MVLIHERNVKVDCFLPVWSEMLGSLDLWSALEGLALFSSWASNILVFTPVMPSVALNEIELCVVWSQEQAVIYRHIFVE